MKRTLLAALLIVTGVAGTTAYSATTNMTNQEKIEYLTKQLEQSNQRISELEENNLALETQSVALIPNELETIEDIATEGVLILNEENTETEVIAEGVKKDEWAISARTYIEREDYSRGDFGATEDIFMLGTGVNMVKGRLGLHLNVEQRLTGHMNTEGADNQNTRVDYKIRYQATDQMGLHFKYRSERGSKKRDAWAAEQGRNRDRFELGTDFNYFDGNFAGWFVVGHDIDSATTGGASKNKGQYYEGDVGPTFQITEKLALRPTFYSTGEFYDNNNEEMLEHQIRLMAIYKYSDKLTLMPRVRYTFSRELEEDSYTYAYESDYRVRAEFLFDYKINEQFSIDGGIAYDWQDRDYDRKTFKETKNIDMIWYYLAANYRF